MDKKTLDQFSKIIYKAISEGLPVPEEDTEISRLSKKIEKNYKRIEVLKMEIHKYGLKKGWFSYHEGMVHDRLLLLRQLWFYQKKALAELIKKEHACERCGEQGTMEKHSCPYEADYNDDRSFECNCCDACAYECAEDV